MSTFGTRAMDEIPAAKLFKKGDRVYVLAQRVWLILVAFAMDPHNRRRRPGTLTYGDLADAMRYDRRAGIMLNTPLGIVGNFCKINNLPTLNSIVVNDITQEPGDHVVVRRGKTPKQEQREVMRVDWFEIRVPTTGTFRKVWEKMGRD